MPNPPKSAAKPLPPNKPIGGAAGADGRLRAQVAYEGDDEFSTMSLDPNRRKKAAVDLTPQDPGSTKDVQVDELHAVRKGGVINFFRKIFEK